MLRLFHELGVVLHFEPEAIRNVVIFHPQWVVNGIAAVIRDHTWLHRRGLKMKASRAGLANHCDTTLNMQAFVTGNSRKDWGTI